MGWKRATTNAETSGTWTNASTLLCVVLRGALSDGTPIGTFQPSAGTTNTITYAAAANSKNIGSSWYVGFIGHRSTDVSIDLPPAGMFSQLMLLGVNTRTAGHDTNGPATASWPSTNVTITGTAAAWQTVVLEVFAEPWKIENFKGIHSTGLSVVGGLR
jgi:hypothetical protein